MKTSLCVLAVLATVGANAQLIVGNDQSGTTSIWEINVNTGVATALYTSNDTTSKTWGMAADNVGNTLY